MGEASEAQAVERYPLVIVVPGVACSDNSHKDRQVRMVDGKAWPVEAESMAAKRWKAAVQRAARKALASLPPEVGHPSTWPVPLYFDVELRNQRIDPGNCLKAMNDALDDELGVDDRFFWYDGMRKALHRGRLTVEGGPAVVLRIRPAQPEEAIRPRPAHTAPLKTGAHKIARKPQGEQTPLQLAIAQAVAAEDAAVALRRRRPVGTTPATSSTARRARTA